MMRFEPLSQHIGVEVHSFDPACSPSPDEAARLRQALDRHHLLLFRNVSLSDAQHIALVEIFGTAADEHLDGERISWVSNKRKGKGAAPGENKLFWHSDYTFTPWPLTAISLNAIEIAGEVAPTRFASAPRAWAALPSDLRERLAGLQALHMANFSGDGADYDLQIDTGEDVIDQNLYPHAWHPMCRLHPRTGEPLLFANEYLTVRVADMSSAEAGVLLGQLWDTLYDPAHLLHLRWEEGDLVLWDNIALQHGRDEFTPPPGGEPPVRTLRRVVVSEDYDKLLDSVPRLKAAMTAHMSIAGFQG